MVYFSEGPYIEIIDKSGMPSIIKTVLIPFRENAVVSRAGKIDQCGYGYCDIVLEGTKQELSYNARVLKSFNIKLSKVSKKRKDSYGKNTKLDFIIPSAKDIPFLITPFPPGTKPKKFIHHNGVSKINKVYYGADEHRHTLIRILCDDNNLVLTREVGIRVEFDKKI